jgi:internalin A
MLRLLAIALFALWALPLTASDVQVPISASWHAASATADHGKGRSRPLKPGTTATLSSDEVLEIECWELEAANLAHLVETNEKAPIVSLRLMFNFLTNEGFAHVCKLSKLTALEIHCRGKLNDEGFAAILSLKALTNLELHNTAIGDAGLAHLSLLPSLKDLLLWGSDRVTSEGFATLAYLPALATLHLYFNPNLDAAAMNGIAGVSTLKCLAIHTEHTFMAEHLRALHGHECLREVDLGLYEEGSADLVPELVGIVGLERVEIDCGEDIADKHVLPLAKLAHLSELVVGSYDPRPKITAEGFSAFCKCPDLKILNLRGCGVTNAGALEIARIESLQTLNISDTPITGAGLKALCGLNRLTRLDLSGCKYIAAMSYAELAHLALLTELDLGGTRADDPALKAVGTLTNLTRLDLTATYVTSAGAMHLSSLKELKRLGLSGCESFGDIGMHALAELACLEYLDLSYSGITGQGLRHLAGTRRLKTLDLSCTNTDDAGLALLKNTTIDFLTITDCSLLTDGCAETLAAMKSLRRLDMRPCASLDADLFERLIQDADTEVWSDKDPIINEDPSSKDDARPSLPKPADREVEQ